MDGVADSDGEWTFDYGNSRITHQRADNSRYYWAYDKGEQNGDNAGIGSLGTVSYTHLTLPTKRIV